MMVVMSIPVSSALQRPPVRLVRIVRSREPVSFCMDSDMRAIPKRSSPIPPKDVIISVAFIQ